MNYVEFEVPAPLRRHVQCLWRLRGMPGAGPEQAIYPDGRCELIVHLGARMRRFTLEHGWQTQARVLFAAQICGAIRLAADAPVDCMGVRLQPAASHALAGAALPRMLDQIVDLREIDAEFEQGWSAACVACGKDGDISRLWSLLSERFALVAIDAQIERVVAAMDAACGDVRIANLARDEGISVRSLQTHFLSQVGLGAKAYARIRRLQATIRYLDEEQPTLADLSIGAGFADQAHATRELRRLTGLTPTRLRRALCSERKGDHTLRMAAAFVRGRA